MKYKNYGDSNEEYTDGSLTEFINCSDPLAARSVNRPLTNLYENQEETYKLLNTLLKSVYGNLGNSIIPDVYEEFSPEGFIINSFKNETSQFFLRIPTGMMTLSNNNYKILKDKSGNPFSKPGEYDYLDEDNKSHYSKDEDSSIIFNNRPNINLLERQLANFIALDLTDLTNDIKVHQKELPMMYPICIVDSGAHFQMRDPDGNLSFVTDNNGNYLYICDNEIDAMYYLTNVKIHNREIKYSFSPQGENPDVFGEDFKTITTDSYYIEKQPSEKIELLTNKPSGIDYVALTTDFEKAKKVKDYNGNEKKSLGYYVEVNRTTSEDDEYSCLPNSKENASWKICLPYGGQIGAEGRKDEYTYTIKLEDHNGAVVERWEIFFYDYASEDNMNNMLFNKLLVEGGDYFNLSKYQFRIGGSEIKHGVKISMKSESVNCDNYRLTISYRSSKDEPGDPEHICLNIDPKASSEEINKVLPSPAQRQKYYNNIFELTNSFLGKFSSYQVNIENIYRYLNGEMIVKIPFTNNFSIYYDLNCDHLNNKSDPGYDKSGKIFVSQYDNLTDTKKNLIKLYDIELEKSSSVGFAPRIKKMICHVKQLDRKSIGTKMAEFNSLLSMNRTELNNYINIKDYDGNRNIEITEDNDNPDKEQIRLTSPIYRASTKNIIEEGMPIEWTDKNNGDTPSDFNDYFTSRNFVNNKKTTYHHTNDDIGLIIDHNKGIKIYSNNNYDVDGKHNGFSNYKPIEITSYNGNINLINENNYKARIGIRNLQDSKNNIIDLLGITRVRSSQDNQLVIRSISEQNKDINKGSSIAFVQGTSNANSNDDALSYNKSKKPEDIILGNILFSSGSDSDKNTINNDRRMTFNLSDADRLNYTSKALVLRNAKTGKSKKIMTMFGDITPDNNNRTLGFPINSRTYNNSTKSKIPYSKDASIEVDDNGNSMNNISSENRWLAAFVNYGYMNKLTLSDREEDINNSDSRNGNLRMGNSNIYDVSSIYINSDNTDSSNRTNLGTINFDNNYDLSKEYSENTIMSSAIQEKDSTLKFILNRTTKSSPNTNTEIEKNSGSGLDILDLNLNGARVSKNLKINRQTFVNNHSGSTTSDNNALVVRGQSVLNGELVVGKTLDDVKMEDYSSYNGYSQNKDDLNHKKYNEEYSGETKEKRLYMLRNYGRTYLKGDVTLEGKYTEKSIFDKYVVINNNAYNNSSYDRINSFKDRFYYTDNHSDNDYGEEPKSISRHHKALDVVNGTVVFGSDGGDTNYDSSDLKLFGSQWIKRRLEVGDVKGSHLIDSFMANEGLLNGRLSKQSPALYIKGASNFEGDVVFGGGIREVDVIDPETEETRHSKIIKSYKSSDSITPIKAIFWGKNSLTSTNNRDASKTDFDFHGSTWFDNIVKIGGGKTDEDSLDGEGRFIVKGKSNALSNTSSEQDLKEWRKSKATVEVDGTLSVHGTEFSEISEKEIVLKAEGDGKASEIKMNYKSGDYRGNLSISSTSDLKLSAGTNVITLDPNETNITANSSLKVVNGKNNLTMNSTSLGIVSGGTISIESASITTINSKNKLVIETPDLDMSNTGKLTLGSSSKKSPMTVHGLITGKNGLDITGTITSSGLITGKNGLNITGSITATENIEATETIKCKTLNVKEIVKDAHVHKSDLSLDSNKLGGQVPSYYCENSRATKIVDGDEVLSKAAINNAINQLNDTKSDIVDNTKILISSDGTNYLRGDMSKLWKFTSGHLSSDIGITASNYKGKSKEAGTADVSYKMKDAGSSKQWGIHYDGTGTAYKSASWWCCFNTNENTIYPLACPMKVVNETTLEITL